MARKFKKSESEFHHLKLPPMGDERQGKCSHCWIRFIWPKKEGHELKKAFCPECGKKLERTTHLSSYAVRYKLPDFTPF